MSSSNGHEGLREIPPAPGDLAPEGVAIWASIWQLPQIGEGDRLTIERLCRLEGEAANLRAYMQEDGPLLKRPIQNAKGEVIGTEVVPHPALTPLRKIGSEAAQLCEALGLTPSGRRRLELPVLLYPEPKTTWTDCGPGARHVGARSGLRSEPRRTRPFSP